VTILTMIDEDRVEDAVYSLWQLAMAMASIKHLARMVRTGDIKEKDDMVTDFDTEDDGIEILEESDTEDSIFITELLQHDNDKESNSDHPITVFQTKEGVSLVENNACNEVNYDTQSHCISFPHELSDQQSQAVDEGFDINEQYKTLENAQHEVITDATDIVTKEIVENEENLETSSDAENWLPSMVTHMVLVADIPMEYIDTPTSMASHMVIGNNEWLTEEHTDVSMQSHQVFAIELPDKQNQENEVENKVTGEINPHRLFALQSIPEIKNEDNDVDKNNDDNDDHHYRSNFNPIISSPKVPFKTDNDHIGLPSYSSLTTYKDIDKGDNKIVNRIESEDIIAEDLNTNTSTDMLTKSIRKSAVQSASFEKENDDHNNHDNKNGHSKRQANIRKTTSSGTKDILGNSFDGDKNDWLYSTETCYFDTRSKNETYLRDIQEDKHEDEMNHIVKQEIESLHRINEDNIDTTESQIITKVKGVEFKSCIVLHQHFEDTYENTVGDNTTQTIKDSRNYENMTEPQLFGNVKAKNLVEKNGVDKHTEEKELKKKDRTLKKSVKTATFNAESKKSSYKIRFKVKLGEDSSKPSALKYLLDLLGGDSLSQN